MIMLKEPLRLKSLSGITYNDAFSEKIRANYEFMTAVMPKEELLHLLLEEPEQEGQRTAVTMIVENVAAANRNEIMIELLNQLLNRILIVGESKLTYQDNVYIGCILRKLGITDINTFLQRIKSSKEEYFLKNQLLKKYEQEKELLKIYYQSENKNVEREKSNNGNFENRKAEIRKSNNGNFENRKDADRILAESFEEGKENYLYEEVVRRLHTMEIYQTVNQWNYMQGIGQKILFHNELALSEQKENVLNMRLAQQKKELVYPHCHMDFISSNLYEAELPENKFVTREKVFSHLLEAAVFSLAKNVSLAAVFRQFRNKKENDWYEIGFEICNVIKNTMSRCQWQYQNPQISILNTGDVQKFLEQQNSLYRYELYVLQKLADSKQSIKESLIYTAEAEDREVKNSLKENILKENSLEKNNLDNNLEKISLDNKEITLKLKELLNGKNRAAVRNTEKWKERIESFYTLNEEEKKEKQQKGIAQEEKGIEQEEKRIEQEEKRIEQEEKKKEGQKEKEQKERTGKEKEQRDELEAENEGTKEKRESKNEKAKQKQNEENKKTYFNFYYEIQRIGMVENYFSKYFRISGKKTKEISEEASAILEKIPVQISEWIEEIFLKNRKGTEQFYQSKQENVVAYFSENWFEEESGEGRWHDKKRESDFSKNTDNFYQAVQKNEGKPEKNTEVNINVKKEEMIIQKRQKEKAEKKEAEKEKLQRENAQREKTEKEKLQREKIEKEKTEREEMKKEKIQREKAEKEKLQKEKIQREKAEKEKLQREELQKEKIQREKTEKEKLQREELQKEKIQREKTEKEKLQREKTEKEKTEKEETKKEKIQKEKTEKEKIQREKIENEEIQKKRAEKEETQMERLQRKGIKEEITQEEKLTEKEMQQIFHELDSQKPEVFEKTEQKNKAAQMHLMPDGKSKQRKSVEISNQQIIYKEFEKQKDVLQDSEASDSYNTGEKVNSEKTAQEKQQKKLIQEDPAEKIQQIFNELTIQKAFAYEKTEQMLQKGASNISEQDMLFFNKQSEWTEQPSVSEKQNIYETYEKQTNIQKKQEGANHTISALHKISQNEKETNEKNTNEKNTNEIQQKEVSQIFHEFISQDQFLDKEINQNNYKESAANPESSGTLVLFTETQSKSAEKILTEKLRLNEMQKEAVPSNEIQQIFHEETIPSNEIQQIFHEEAKSNEIRQIFHEEAESNEIQQIFHEEAESNEIRQIFHEIETEILHNTQKTARNLQIDRNHFSKPKAAEIIYRQTGQGMPESADFNENANKTVTITEKMTSQNKIKLSRLPTTVHNQAKTDTKQINEVVQVIQSNIQKQINQITDQVYQKIEKKLQNERRRRGL